MGRSVAQGRRRGRGTDIATTDPPAAGISRRAAVVTGLALVAAALAVYLVTYVDRYYDHFVWQAAAFLEGHAAIRYPVEAAAGLNGNAYFQDVLPIATSDGVPRGLLPFPPLPALVLVPFVAVWGLATNDQLLFTVLAAVDVGLAWWMLGRLPVGPAVRLGTTVFFAFGTVFWYTAQQSTTWFQAHVVAVGLTFLAIGLAIGADRDAAASGAGRPSRAHPTIRRSTRPGPPADAGRRRSIAASSRPGSCSGWPARRGRRSSSGRRSSRSSERARIGVAAPGRPAWAPPSRSWPCSRMT